MPLTAGRAPGVRAAIDLGSPALFANVARLGSGSLSVGSNQSQNHTFSILHVHDALNLCFTDVGGGIFEGLFRTLLCDSEISARPFPGDGIRLGCGN